MDSKRERYDRMERQAEAERRPGDPVASRPRNARLILGILGSAFLLAVLLFGGMYFNNTRYDGAAPAPVSERR
ncbi:MAG: hypothetical protein ACOY4R_29180 [Pseudomonadota bacterium]